MAETFRWRDLVSRWDAAVLGVALALFLGVAAGGCAHSECQEVPVDEFSAQIDPLLTAVEGPDFPSASNLASWHERRGNIRAKFGEILELTEGNTQRRRAAIHTLVAAESLSASESEATEVTGSEGGEVRAWARHVLKGYASIGVTPADRRLVDAGIIDDLQEAWETEDYPQRNLAPYQEKAGALRGLASFRQSPLCEKTR